MNNQSELFPRQEQKTYGELARDEDLALALSDQVKAETMAVYRANAGEFIWYNTELQKVKEKYDLGTYFNDTIRQLHKEGKLIERKVYHGAESPCGVTDLGGKRKLKKGEKAPLPYLGYHVEHMAAEETA